MQTTKQIMAEREALAKHVNLNLYFEKCESCGAPARSEDQSSPLSGIETFQFCVNVYCINFDGSNLRQKRETLERHFREAAVGRRARSRLWKLEIRKMQRRRRKIRQALEG